MRYTNKNKKCCRSDNIGTYPQNWALTRKGKGKDNKDAYGQDFEKNGMGVAHHDCGRIFGPRSFRAPGKRSVDRLELASQILPLIGMIDIAVAIIVLVKPFRVVLIWAVAWGFWTALLRPLVGEPIWDFVERWANWGAPLALFLLYQYRKKGEKNI